MEHKNFPAIVLKKDPMGVVEAIVAVMGNVDQGKDIVHSGAFTKTLVERRGKIKVLDQHRTDSILRVIGKCIDAREYKRDELPSELLSRCPEATGGLWTKTQFLMDTPEGEGAFKRIQAGAVDEWSFGYDVLDHDYSKVKVSGRSETVRNLRTLKLYEYSPVVFGMNDMTETTGTKEGKPDGNKATSLTELVEEVSNAFSAQYGRGINGMDMWVREVYDEYVIVCCYTMSGPSEFYQVAYTRDETTDAITFVPKAEWLAGDFVFVANLPAETAKMSTAEKELFKAGRVQAARNASRLQGIMKLVRELMGDAGMEDEKPDAEDKPKPKKPAPPTEPNDNNDKPEKPKEDVARSDASSTPPTLEAINRLLKTIEIELETLDL